MTVPGGEGAGDESVWGPCTCEEEAVGTHWKGCHLRPMQLTKADFVSACEGGAGAAIDDYVFFLAEGESPEDAKQQAIEQASESGACFAGIGSCCGGGCKHG